MSSYSYDWADFSDGEDLDAKKIDMRVVAEEEISTECISVTVHGTAETVEFAFENDLSGDEQTALDGVVAAYECEALDEMKSRKIFELDECTKTYMHARYPAHDLTLWVAMLTNAYHEGYTERYGYIEELFTWAISISVGYFNPKKGAIAAAADKAAVEAITFSVAECEAAFDDDDGGWSIATAITKTV